MPAIRGYCRCAACTYLKLSTARMSDGRKRTVFGCRASSKGKFLRGKTTNSLVKVWGHLVAPVPIGRALLGVVGAIIAGMLRRILGSPERHFCNCLQPPVPA